MKKATVCLLLCTMLLFGTVYGAETETSSFSVTFLENQTTGYKWFTTVSDEAVLAVADHGFQPEDTGGMVGAGGKHTWTVTGVGPGEASVSFYSAWAWTEELTQPDVTYTFTSDGAGALTLTSIEGMPEQYMPGKVAVRLKENPTTGYQWNMQTDVGGVLVPVDDVYEPNPDSADVAGAGGVHTWFFNIEGAGTVVLTFRYARSFEPEETPAATLVLTYLVDEQLDAMLMGLDGNYAEYLADVP